jgi:hypothetical protein
MKLGIAGFSAQSFDKDKAIIILKSTFSRFKQLSSSELEIVSGYTNLGVPALAYGIAKKQGLRTTGIACVKAYEHELFPVDKKFIKTEWQNWGDESDFFLSYIDALICVGGGKQTAAEYNKFKVRYPNKLVDRFNV